MKSFVWKFVSFILYGIAFLCTLVVVGLVLHYGQRMGILPKEKAEAEFAPIAEYNSLLNGEKVRVQKYTSGTLILERLNKPLLKNGSPQTLSIMLYEGVYSVNSLFTDGPSVQGKMYPYRPATRAEVKFFENSKKGTNHLSRS